MFRYKVSVCLQRILFKRLGGEDARRRLLTGGLSFMCGAGSHSGREESGLQSRWEVVGFSQ